MSARLHPQKEKTPKLIEDLRNRRGAYTRVCFCLMIIYPVPALVPVNPPCITSQVQTQGTSGPLPKISFPPSVQHSQPIPHILGKPKSDWRLSRLKYNSDRPPTNPGLLALSRGDLGGVFAVHNIIKRRAYAMEILHLPSLKGKEFLRAMKKLKILRKIQTSQGSRFVLQASCDFEASIWWSDYLYLHIVTVSAKLSIS